MQTIKDLLNKIKLDKRENPKIYSIFYFDRIIKKLNKFPFINIKKLEGSFIIIERNNEEINVPMHRIRKVTRNNIIVWERKIK